MVIPHSSFPQPLETTGLLSVFMNLTTLGTSYTVTPWTVAFQAPLSMEFSRQEYWSGFPFPSLEDLPNPGIESRSPALWAESLPSEPAGKPYTPGASYK